MEFTTVTGGNRRAIKRKMARVIDGAKRPPATKLGKYLARTSSAFVLPDVKVTVKFDRTVHEYHRPYKREIPAHERPSKVTIIRPV